ncbi:MAG: hypothetical protein IVW52_13185 [Acidimicrobiales bacterium]|nr:hypothetical protein [Acidimicrobiales bacterium]
MPLTSTPDEEPFVDDLSSDSPESLVLDIGDDIGALILYADESCLGREIDVTPVGHPHSHQIHTMIRRRRSVDSEFIAGVYPELRQGTYTVWGLDEGALAEVTIGGGRITELDVGDCAGPGSDPGPSSR